MTHPEPRGLSGAALELLDAIAHRAEAAARIEPPGGAAVLRSIVEATVALFDAEASSIALYDRASDRLVFRVAAGDQGQGVVGVSIAPHEGVAGYVFSTGQPMAIADVAADPRFGSDTARRTGYVPRSLLAVPLMDDDDTLGVLEILDRRDAAGFDLRDVELASVFARQATVAIRATRLEHDTATLLREALRAFRAAATVETAETNASDDVIDEIVSAATAGLEGDTGGALWRLADRIARLRTADPEQVDLLVDLLDVLLTRAERRRGTGSTGGRSGGYRLPPT
jgi:GAF domain-containing protein